MRAGGRPSVVCMQMKVTLTSTFKAFPQDEATRVFVPVVDHQLLHGQQGVVAHELVLVVHVIHHQLFSTQLFNHPVMGDNGRERLPTKQNAIFIF